MSLREEFMVNVKQSGCIWKYIYNEDWWPIGNYCLKYTYIIHVPYIGRTLDLIKRQKKVKVNLPNMKEKVILFYTQYLPENTRGRTLLTSLVRPASPRYQHQRQCKITNDCHVYRLKYPQQKMGRLNPLIFWPSGIYPCNARLDQH